MDSLTWIKKMTGETDEDLLSLLLSDAEGFALSYTGRTHIIPALQKPVRDLALIAYNRMGTEGETGRSEGGESYSFEAAPRQIYEVLDRYRLAGIGGRIYEAKKETAGTIQPPEGGSPEG